MNKIWFKAKRYGWGWTPSTWEGWLSLVIFIVLQFANARRLEVVSESPSNTVVIFIIETIVLVAALIAVCYWKGEKPSWRWGDRDAGKDDLNNT
ncbi:MAG: hypothetical protein RL094_459 [Candidatus Parcubacteria bacterium]|jgi:uncharacterized membrane protein YhaH (DUF805 family)